MKNTNKKAVIVLTTVPPIGNEGGRQEKIMYRCNRLLEAGYKPIVVRPEIRYTVHKFDLQEGTVEYHGQKNPVSDALDNSESIISRRKQWLKDRLNIVLDLTFGNVTDPEIIRLPTTIKHIHQLVGENTIAINTQSYPFTNNLVGLLIKRLYPDLKWIMEYRDPWIGNPNHFPENGNIVTRRIENACIDGCDDMIYYDGIQVEEGYYESRYPNQSDSINRVGHIGYNDLLMNQVPAKNIEPFTIIYAGSFWGSGTETTTLFDAVHEFVQANELDPTDFQLLFLGDEPEIIAEEVQEFVSALGWLPYSEAMSYVKGADYGLYVNRLFEGDELNVSTKMYDYIGAKTPVLCLSKKGWQSWEFVTENKVGTVASIDKKRDIQTTLEEIYHERNHEIDETAQRQFARQKPWERFLSLLEPDVD